MIWKLLLKLRVESSGIYMKGSALKISATLFLLSQNYWHQSYQVLVVQKSRKGSSETTLIIFTMTFISGFGCQFLGLGWEIHLSGRYCTIFLVILP